MIYQNVFIRNGIIQELEKILKQDEKIIWRDAFRWHDKDGVLSNHYESASIKSLCEEFDYKLIYNFNHVAVIKEL